MRVLGSDPDVPDSELLFELPIQKMVYELLLELPTREDSHNEAYFVPRIPA